MTTKFIFLLSLCCCLALGCGNDEGINCDDRPTNAEFIANNNLMPQTTPEGLQYIIGAPGGPERATLTDTVTVRYTGYFPDEDQTIFDSRTDSIRFPLNGLIQGWQLGIPLIGEGGSIQLFVPPGLGYGGRQVGTICPNSDLVFDIELLNITPR